MTCIVGEVRDGNVWIGGDSAGVAGYELDVRADTKVWSKAGFVFGFTSSFRMGQLLRYRLSVPPHHPSTTVDRYMCVEFIDAVRACLKDGGYAKASEGREAGGSFLVGYAGRLFSIGSDYQVGESTSPFDAVGCGAATALGAMAAQSIKDSPRARIERALAVAERYSAGVRGPFHVVDNIAEAN